MAANHNDYGGDYLGASKSSFELRSKSVIRGRQNQFEDHVQQHFNVFDKLVKGQ